MLKNLTKFFFIIFMNTVPLVSNGMEETKEAAAVSSPHIRVGEVDVVLDHDPTEHGLTIQVKGPEGETKQEADLFKILDSAKDLLNISGLKKVSMVFSNVNALLEGDLNAYFGEGINWSIFAEVCTLGASIICPKSGTLTIDASIISGFDSILKSSTLFGGSPITIHTPTPEELKKQDRDALKKLGASEELLARYDAIPGRYGQVFEIRDLETLGEIEESPLAAILTALGKTREDFYRAKGYPEDLILKIRTEDAESSRKKRIVLQGFGASEELLEGKDLNNLLSVHEILKELDKTYREFYGVLYPEMDKPREGE